MECVYYLINIVDSPIKLNYSGVVVCRKDGDEFLYNTIVFDKCTKKNPSKYLLSNILEIASLGVTICLKHPLSDRELLGLVIKFTPLSFFYKQPLLKPNYVPSRYYIRKYESILS